MYHRPPSVPEPYYSSPQLQSRASSALILQCTFAYVRNHHRHADHRISATSAYASIFLQMNASRGIVWLSRGARRLRATLEGLAEHEELDLVVDGQDTSAGNTTEDVGTSTLEERLDTLLSDDLGSSVHGRLVLDGLARGHHHTTTDGVERVRGNTGGGGDSPAEAVKYKSSMDAASQIVAKEGVKSLFKGAGPNILRGVAGAGVLSIYDQVQLLMFGKAFKGGS